MPGVGIRTTEVWLSLNLQMMVNAKRKLKHSKGESDEGLFALSRKCTVSAQ